MGRGGGEGSRANIRRGREVVDDVGTEYTALFKFSSIARYEVRLPKVNRRQRGTSTDSPKSIVSEKVNE